MVIGCFQMSYISTNQTLLQSTAPEEFRGRVLGILMLARGLPPLGSLFAGILADFWGAPFAILVMGRAASL